MADLNALVVFAKVVEANSFSEAARRLKMPISTVSRRIADLEEELGVRLLERSTRSLRLTDIGAEVYEQAQRTVEISDAVEHSISYQLSHVSGLLRLSAPPNLSDSLVAPLVLAFQASYPHVRVQLFVTDRVVDHITEGIDLAFHVGALKDSSMVATRLLVYRHRLLASPGYLQKFRMPETPADLNNHRLLAFSHHSTERTWNFLHEDGVQTQSLTVAPYLSMNDFSGLVPALIAGSGIGDLPPVVQPNVWREGLLVEVMPQWRFRTFDLSIVHLGKRHVPRPVRLFKELAIQMTPSLFPDLPV